MKRKEEIKGKRQKAEGKEQRASSKEQKAKGKGQKAKGQEPGADGRWQKKAIKKASNFTIRQFDSIDRNSTVFQIKPSATGTSCSTEGRISEFRAIRACLMIRVFNN